MPNDEIAGPDIVSARKRVGLNDKGVLTTVMEVVTELPLFPDDPGFDQRKLNKLLSTVGAWQARNFPIQVHIYRTEMEDAPGN